VIKKFKRLAEVWNQARVYPANYDMERALNVKMRTIREWVRSYRTYRDKNPDCGLPDLILRHATTGSMIAAHESIVRQLDEFRFHTECLKNAKGIIITSAQFGSPLNTWVWKGLKKYAQYRGFPIAVLPIRYGIIVTKNGRLTSTFPDELKGHIVLEDIPIAKGQLNISTYRMRPTLQRFLTDEVCETGGNISQIMAAPALELEHRPRFGHSQPKAIMTTGAITHPMYGVNKLGQQDRTGEIATKNHCFAAIIVEFTDKGFHFRQLHANKRGEFYDINTEHNAVFVSPNGVRSAPGEIEALVTGDYHVSKTCPKVRMATFGPGGMTDLLKPKKVVSHDFFDGDEISEHGVHETTRAAYMGPLQWDSLERGLNRAVKELDWIHERTDAELYMIPSNHPEFVAEYINSMRWTKEKANMEIGARLFLMMVEDLKKRKPLRVHSRATDPIILWFREKAPYAHMVERQDEFMLNGILLSLHGDKGMRGGKTRSLREFRKANCRVVLGHNHTAEILGPVWRVGTSTPLTQFYVQSPKTNWTNTHLVIFKNGQRQLINIIKGRWK